MFCFYFRNDVTSVFCDQSTLPVFKPEYRQRPSFRTTDCWCVPPMFCPYLKPGWVSPFIFLEFSFTSARYYNDLVRKPGEVVSRQVHASDKQVSEIRGYWSAIRVAFTSMLSCCSLVHQLNQTQMCRQVVSFSGNFMYCRLEKRGSEVTPINSLQLKCFPQTVGWWVCLVRTLIISSGDLI